MRPGLVLATVAVLGSALGVAPTTSAGPDLGTGEAVVTDRPAVIGTRLIGRSVRGRPLRAWHLGERGEPKVLLVSTMHGDEPHTRQILTSLRDGRPIHGVDLWVLPTYNPDGLARHTRKNAHGVDLNRNFPYRWAELDGDYESGPRPASEPETRAVMRFLRDIRPRWIISFHQPLYGVDRLTKDRRFSRRVARALNLPLTSLSCGGVCHGTMTSWFNHRFSGAALTAEYGAHPSRHRMQVTAPRQVLTIWDAYRHR